MSKKNFNFNFLIVFLVVAIIAVILLWGFVTNWKFWITQTDPIPGPPGLPGPAPGIASPPSFLPEKQLAVQKYLSANYPGMSGSSAHPDFWKSLDFFWNMTCYTSKNDRSYIPDPTGSSSGNAVFRHLVTQFQTAISPDKTFKWLTYTPALSTINDGVATAGFTYKPTDAFVKMGQVSLPVFDLYLMPLCSWHMNSAGIPPKVNAVVVNRYPQGHLRTRALGYAAPGTANEIVTPGVLPGVDSIIINSGFKSYSSVEIMHCDTHLTSMSSSLECLNSCDLLGNKCAGRGPPGVGYGKWLYYARGSGLWIHLGKTIVFRSKIDSIMSCINAWDGMDARDGSRVNEAYTGTLKGQFDSTKLESWQRFIADSKNTVKLALQTLLTGSCLTPATSSANFPSKPSTAVISMLDVVQPQCPSMSLDYLGIGSGNYTRGPCSSKAGYPDPSKNSFPVALWWFWADDGRTQGNWGLLAPLAPLKFTRDSDICAWVLWACVNGYDFATNPENYTWNDAVTNKYFNKSLSPLDLANNSIILNSLLNNMSNSGYSTDDFLINLANYMKLDSVQLTTSQILGNVVSFEILVFSGTVKENSDPTKWICEQVDNSANMECAGSPNEPSNWLGGKKSLIFSKDPLSGSDDKSSPMVVTINTCSQKPGYNLVGPVTTYSDSGGVGAPLSDLISKC